MTDEGFSTEVVFRPSCDYRDDRDDRNDQRGAHGMDIILILHGPLGAITCRISTGWLLRPIADPHWTWASQAAPRRAAKVGVDWTVRDHYPSGAGVSSHTPVRVADYQLDEGDCDVLPGGRCYGDVGYLASDQIVHAMVAEGSDGAWRVMREFYDEWIAALSAVTPYPDPHPAPVTQGRDDVT